MNFTSDVKKEIISKGMDVKGRKAGISAFLRTSGDVGINDGIPAFYFVSETENVAEFFTTTFFETFGEELYISHASRDKMSGRAKLVLQCAGVSAPNFAKELGLLKRNGGLREGISLSLIARDSQKIAYIQGAFLGGGSCIVPTEGGKTGYHLEFVFFGKKIAKDFCDLLAEFELIAKVAERKESFVVYIKSKELISDFLSIVGAKSCLKKFSQLVEKRDKANNDNRARNCIAGNADKTAIAAVKQIFALEKLKKSSGFGELSAELRALTKTRIENPTMSLQELAETLGVSKSCLNHRMRKLMELSADIDGGTKEKEKTEEL